MKDRVNIYFNTQAINVDGERYVIEGLSLSLIKDKLPTDVDFTGVESMGWSDRMNLKTKGYIALKNGGVFTFGEDKYDDYIQPYVDLWQLEKDKHDQEIEEANSFPVRQAKALTQLNFDFETVKERAHLKSSLGFTADANPTAKENVQGLIEEVGTGTVQFCDYYNQFQELNKSQLETLKSEINKNGQALYAQKWQYRTAIEQCSDNEGLDQVVAGIEFTYMDFTQ